jgi:hypothetical protein
MDERDSPSPTGDILAVEAALRMYHQDTGRFPLVLNELLDVATSGMEGGYIGGRRGRETIQKVGYRRMDENSVCLTVSGSERLLTWNGCAFVATWVSDASGLGHPGAALDL